MFAHIVPIGNSKGIRIPKAILKQCHIEKEVNLEVKGNSIIIKPAEKISRENWEQAFKSMHDRGEDRLLINDALDLDMETWQW